MPYVNGQSQMDGGDTRMSPPGKFLSVDAVTPNNTAPRRGARGFHKAVKSGAKARVAFVGVAGSGKSYTALILARELAGIEGKICAIDTEHGSLSKYADQFAFDVDEPSSYSTDDLLDQLTYAEQNGYAVFLTDSLSHYWMGKDGALEFVDSAARRSKDKMEGWKNFRPHERKMVDRFLASPCHIIVTMRTKTDYEEIIVDGKKKRVKVGLAPVQRDGLEYEFDFVCSMDDENNLLIDKTRCSVYSEQRLRTCARPGAEYFKPFIEWLDGPAAVPKSVETTKAPEPAPAETVPWRTMGQMAERYMEVREIIGEVAFRMYLEKFGWNSYRDIVAAIDKKFPNAKENAVECYKDLVYLAQKEVA